MLKIYISTLFNSYTNLAVDVSNDRYFNRHWREYDFSNALNNTLIKLIDNTKIVNTGWIESKFIPGMAVDIRNLSTGCKTALNIVNNPDKIFLLSECGDNALEEVLKFKQGIAILDSEIVVPHDLDNEIDFEVNGKEFTLNKSRGMQSLIDKAFKGEI